MNQLRRCIDWQDVMLASVVLALVGALLLVGLDGPAAGAALAVPAVIAADRARRR